MIINLRIRLVGMWSICFVFLASPVPIWAGSWPLPPGDGQIIQTNLAVKADRGFDQNGKLSQPVQFSKFETGIFWEHGLTDTSTLVLASSFQDLQFRAGVEQVNFSGFGETEIGLRHVLWRDGASVVAGQATVIFAGPGEAVSDADLGIGGTQYEVRVLAGRSFKLAGRDGFLDAQIARRFRAGNIPQEWRMDISAGVRPHPQWQALAQTFYVYGQSAPGLARSNYRLKAQASLVYDRNHKTSYQIGGYQTVVGKNIIQEKAIFLSIWQRY